MTRPPASAYLSITSRATARNAARDTLVAIDGIRASDEILERVLKLRRADDVVSVQAFRRDELMEFSVELDAAPLDTCWLALADDANRDARARRRAWLGESSIN
jgi:predicted metalloprotease with PDZ domain